jgi:hypothetical protein
VIEWLLKLFWTKPRLRVPLPYTGNGWLVMVHENGSYYWLWDHGKQAWGLHNAGSEYL